MKTSQQVPLSSEAGHNSLSQHGPVIVEGKRLLHEDKTPFFWLADTWWYGMTKRVSWPGEFQKIVQDRVKKGFTVSMVVVGVPPEVVLDSPQANSESGQPFVKKNGQFAPNPAYFEAVDQRIQYLIDQGIVPCIVGGWGHQIDVLGVETLKKWWAEILARYAALPVVFCLAGEVEMMTNPAHFLEKTPPSIFRLVRKITSKFLKVISSQKSESAQLQAHLEKWRQVGEYIYNTDPFKHPILCHTQGLKTASELFSHPEWLAIDGFQSGHRHESRSLLATNLLRMRASQKPVINLEPWYEGILGDFGPREQRYAFWVSILAGGAGHAYGAHGLWNMQKNDGFMKHWGEKTWREALKAPGSEQLGKAAKWLQKRAWWKFTPDLEKISPHWSTQHPEMPVLASNTDKEMIAYFPKWQSHQHYRLQGLKKNTAYTVEWLLASTMEVIQQEKMKTDPQGQYALALDDKKSTGKDIILYTILTT